MTPQQLRASLLQQALSGRLLPQRPEDGTADTLYKEIQQEKARLIAEKKIKKEKPLPPITEEEKPFDIPDTWKWVRLGDVSTYGQPKEKISPSAITGDMWSLDLEDIEKDTGKILFIRKATERKISGERLVFHKGQILYCKLRPYLKKILLAPADGITSSEMVPIWLYANVNPKFVIYFLKSPNTDFCINSVTYGIKMPRVGTNTMLNLLMPLPPLAEQERIVARLEELLPLVDQYGDAAARLADYEARFPDDLRKSLLQEAITGRLVPQRAEDGTADALYEAIQKEKARLIAEKKIKKEKPLPPITEEDIPFDIPDTWKWVRFGDISTYGQPKEKISPSAITGDMWSLDLEDIEKDTGKILFTRKASERKITGERLIFHKGQVLYCKLRPYLKKILLAPADGITSPEMVPVWLYAHVNPKFVVYFLKSPNTDFCINSVTYGVKMPRVGTDTMLNLLMPLPPIAEQKRIVAKLEELLPLAERIRSAR